LYSAEIAFLAISAKGLAEQFFASVYYSVSSSIDDHVTLARFRLNTEGTGTVEATPKCEKKFAVRSKARTEEKTHVAEKGFGKSDPQTAHAAALSSKGF
jgi:hypothetical protein